MRDKKQKNALLWIGCGCLVSLLAIIVPMIINWMYSIPGIVPFFAMSWDAKDALSFYGTLLSSAATIYAVWVTINFTVRNQKETKKLEIRPYLRTEWSTINQENIDVLPEKAVYIRDSIVRTYSKNRPAELTSGFDEQTKFFQENYVMLYKISNCGANSAIDIHWAQHDYNVVTDFCLSTNESKYFVLILNHDLLKNNKDHGIMIHFEFRFSDVCSLGHYLQTESFHFYNDKYMGLCIGQVGEERLSKIEEVKK